MADYLTAPVGATKPLSESAIKWFDQSQVDGVLVYQTQNVIAALVDAAYMRSIYGAAVKSDVHIVERNEKSYVTKADILKGPFLEVRDEKRAADAVKWLDRLKDVFLDESVVLGQVTRPDINAAPTPDKWDFPCFGIVNLDDLVPGLFLKPTRVSYSKRDDGVDGFEITITEQSQSQFAKGRLVLSLSPATSTSATLSTLETQAELLVDESGNGGWERVRPLWIRTDEGFLRIGEPEATDAPGPDVRPYAVSAETRALDLSRNATFLEEHASCLVHLDASGDKSLTIRFDLNGPASTAFEITDPCVGVVWSRRTCNPSTMAVRGAPPGTTDLDAGTPLYLVSLPASSVPADIPNVVWDVALVPVTPLTGTPLRLQLNLKSALGGIPVHHYAPSKNLVMGPAAAVNDATAEASWLRSLIPHRSDAADMQMSISAQGIVTAGLTQIDWQLAADSGLVTRYGFEGTALPTIVAHVEEEFDASGAPRSVPNAPAVLRSEYCHMHNSETDRAPIGSTYVFNAPGKLEYRVRVRCPWSAADSAAQRIYATHPQLGISSRADDAKPSSVDQFGWWATQRFFSTRVPNGPSFPHEWLEVNRQGDGPWKARQWCRLSDDSLVKSDRGETASDQADLLTFWAKPTFKFSTTFNPDHAGLSNFQLTEEVTADGSTFTLWNDNKVLWESKAAGQGPKVVNRLIISAASSDAPIWNISADLRYGITTRRINRIFIELYRWGSQFKLVRCMLGWDAAKVFGFDSEGQFHVTEFIEDAGGAPKRSIELNGHVKVLEKEGIAPNTITMEAFFWAAVIDESRKPDQRILRVLCRHKLFLNSNPKPVQFVALHDARIVENDLDLSSDLVLMGTDDRTPGNVAAKDAWEPDRRRLFKAQIDPVSMRYAAKAFVRLRYGNGGMPALGVPAGPPKQFVPTIIPAWAECMAQITPWFTNDEEDRRKRSSWLGGDRLLRDIAKRTAGSNLEVTVFWLGAENDLAPDRPLRACTLAASTIDGKSLAQMGGVPTWMPCPVRGLETEEETAIQDPEKQQAKLWLFAPWPQIAARWPAGTDEENVKRAKTTLIRLGWTREAVVETTLDAHIKRWNLVDSPLLNREAHVGWFGWPLYGDSEHPTDALASSEQIVHQMPSSPSRVAIQTVFDEDLPKNAPFSALVHEPLFDPSYPPEPPPVGFANMMFMTRGLRVGALHQAVRFSALEPKAQEVVPEALPPVQAVEDLEIEGVKLPNGNALLKLLWGRKSGLALQNVDVSSGIKLKIEPVGDGWNAIRPLQGPPGLAIKVDGKWVEADYRTSIKLTSPVVDALEVSVPAGQPWTQTIVRFEKISANGEAGPPVSRSYFVDDDVSRTWVGVFVNGMVHAFGAVPARFRLTTNGAAASWERTTEFSIPMRSVTDKAYVVDVDAFGHMVAHVTKGATSL